MHLRCWWIEKYFGESKRRKLIIKDECRKRKFNGKRTKNKPKREKLGKSELIRSLLDRSESLKASIKQLSFKN